MVSFPYLRKGSQVFPLIDITLEGAGKSSLTLKALVDSGASLSVFRAEVLDYLGIPLLQGRRLYLEGIGGRIVGYLHRLSATVGEERFFFKVVFSQELTVSFNLLGRDNFFRQFRVTFDEQRRIVELTHYRSADLGQ